MDIDHQVQLTILRELLFHPEAHFAQLNKTDLTNDHFTFHLKHLIEKGIVEKTGEVYKLTPMGLEIAGRLDIRDLGFVHQPKVGVSLCVSRNNGKELLLGRRLKDPLRGKVGFYAEKVRFGESLVDTAKRCLLMETGLKADFAYAGERRIIRKEQDIIVTDVLFTCFRTTNIWGELKEKTVESENFWINYAEAYKLPDRFPDLEKDLDCYQKKGLFFEELIT